MRFYAATLLPSTLPLRLRISLFSLGILFLMGVVCLPGCKREQPEFEKLAMRYALPAPKAPRAAKSSNKLRTPYHAGISAYSQGNYEGAITLLEQVPISDPTYHSSQLYIGISQVIIGRYLQAEGSLKKAAQAESWPTYEPAHFYLAISLLAQGFPDLACTYLSKDGYHLSTWYGPNVQTLSKQICP